MDALHPDVGVESEVPVIVRGEGVWVYDQYGKRYLDGLSGLFTSQVGHGRTELAEAGGPPGQHPGLLPPLELRPPHGHRAGRPPGRTDPGGLNRIFFTTGGSEAVESAWKLARQYFAVTGQPERKKVISRNIAYHGATMGALSITGVTEIRSPFEPLVAGAVKVPNTNFYRATVLRRRPRGLRPVGGRRHRAGHPLRRAGDGGRRLPRAGTERRRLLPTSPGLLPAGPPDL